MSNSLKFSHLQSTVTRGQHPTTKEIQEKQCRKPEQVIFCSDTIHKYIHSVTFTIYPLRLNQQKLISDLPRNVTKGESEVIITY